MPIKGESDSAGQSKSTLILVIIIVVILCVAGGVGVALWQLGIFSSDTVKVDEVRDKILNNKTTMNSDKELKYEETTLLQNKDKITPTPATTVISNREGTNYVNQVDKTVTQNNLEATVQLTTIESIPVMQTSTAKSENTPAIDTIKSPEFTTSREDISYQEITMLTTPFIHYPTEETLILTERKRKDDKMLMLLTGGIHNTNNDQEIGEIIGNRKRRKDDGCQTLVSWAPHFTKFIGTAFLSSIDAIVSCGYSDVYEDYEDHSKQFSNYPMTSCFIYNKILSEWKHVDLIQRMGFYEGAFFTWHNRLVLFGGNSISRRNNDDISRSITRSITIFEFSAVKDLYGFHGDSEEMYGSGDSYDDNDDNYEGSTDDDEDTEVKIMMVEEADHLLEEYGPGLIEGCAVTLKEKANSVSFIVTGGKNEGPNGLDGRTMRKTLKANLKIDQHGLPALARDHEFLPLMNYARKQHGCAKIFINGEDTLIVAGGSNGQDGPIPEVEFLGLNHASEWKIFGTLQFPRYGFPTIGKVLGRVIIVGGKSFERSEHDNFNLDSPSESVEQNIEVFEEKIHNFRSALITDNLGKSLIEITSYDYYGILFPKSWCH